MSTQVSDVLYQIMPMITTVMNMFIMIYLLKTVISMFRNM